MLSNRCENADITATFNHDRSLARTPSISLYSNFVSYHGVFGDMKGHGC